MSVNDLWVMIRFKILLSSASWSGWRRALEWLVSLEPDPLGLLFKTHFRNKHPCRPPAHRTMKMKQDTWPYTLSCATLYLKPGAVGRNTLWWHWPRVINWPRTTLSTLNCGTPYGRSTRDKFVFPSVVRCPCNYDNLGASWYWWAGHFFGLFSWNFVRKAYLSRLHFRDKGWIPRTHGSHYLLYSFGPTLLCQTASCLFSPICNEIFFPMTLMFRET
jgi:hypothetical protein